MSSYVSTKTLKKQAAQYTAAGIVSAFALAASFYGTVHQMGMVGDAYQNLSSLRSEERHSPHSIDMNRKQQVEARPTYEWLKLGGAAGAALLMTGATVGFGLGAYKRYDALHYRGF